MILLAAFLLLVAVGLLAGGLAQGSASLQWASFAASALAALVLAGGEHRRRRAAAAAGGGVGVPVPEATQREVGALVTAPAAAAHGPAATPPSEVAPEPVAPIVPPSSAPETTVQPAQEPAGAEPVVAEPVVVEPTVAEPVMAESPVAESPVAESPVAELPGAEPARHPGGHRAGSAGPATGSSAVVPVLGPDGEPPVEEVEVTDLLLVLDLTDEVLVIDEHPRYHLAGCPHLDGVETIPLRMDEARTDGFTPCATCAPDRNLAERERTRRA